MYMKIKRIKIEHNENKKCVNLSQKATNLYNYIQNT